ncbi:MAG: hypothetical protein KDB72_10965 [Mycobacterium sp.]|nr:hypothetical protein [Mycobacterium sp.]
MRLVSESGLWLTGPSVAPIPLAAALELDGAVLAWTVDEAADAPPQITFTDPARADWLWRVVGEDGHRVLAAATTAAAEGEVELSGVELRTGSLVPLRRLALGHWLRRWWPASIRDGVAGLNPAVLDAEIAVATAGADEFFGDDTLDSDIAALLAPHAGELRTQLLLGDPRVAELVRRCAELADEFGVEGPGWAELADALADTGAGTAVTPAAASCDDYALAAGRGGGPEPAAVIERGATSMAWGAVPGAVFDAAENTVDWIIAVADSAPVALVRADVVGPGSPIGIPVTLQHNAFRAAGILDGSGRATLAILGADDQPAAARVVWDTDWSNATVTVGAQVDEGPEARDRVRRFARRRLADPHPDAFLAEILAAESDY